MAESTLSLKYSDLAKEIAFYLGWGRAVPTDAGKLATVESVLQGGLRQFYYPSNGHRWSFLEKTGTLATVADDDEYDLPDDFGHLVGHVMTFTTELGYPPIRLVGEHAIRTLNQSSSSTGRPSYMALRPKEHDGSDTVGQRFELVLWPTPDAVYALTYRYAVLVGKLTGPTPDQYPPGGMEHADTILESCLATAERTVNDELGLHNQRFAERLAASIAIDNRVGCPDLFGYNRDESDSFGIRGEKYRIDLPLMADYIGPYVP